MIPRFLGQRDNASNAQAQVAVKNAAAAAESFYQQGETFGPAGAATVADGTVGAYIRSSEPALTVSAAAFANDFAQLPQSIGGDAVPNTIFVGPVVTGGKAGTIILCAAGKGNKAYCIQPRGTDSTLYGASAGSGESGNLAASGALGAAW